MSRPADAPDTDARDGHSAEIRDFKEIDWPQMWSFLEDIGRALGLDMLAWARNGGYRGSQFNAVAESNEPAVHMYHSLGFTTVGTVPGAFRHPQLGDVGLHVMFHDLAEPSH